MLSPHVIATKSFALGVTWTLGVAVMVWAWHTHSTICRIAVFAIFVAQFHFLEFLVTAVYNPRETDDDSFILNDTDLHVIYVAAVAEAAVQSLFFPVLSGMFWLGLSLMVIGQAARTIAMQTAGKSFNHYVQKEHSTDHVLVTSGIYRFLRHPSYFGFFWWFVGTQLLMQNWVILVFGCYKLHGFFSRRIFYEENLLLSFFGDDYSNYRARTPVRIPLIK